jgi:hypothetical protein
VWFEGDEPDVATMCERLVFTLEVWNASIAGREHPRPGGGAGPALLERFDRAARDFTRLIRAIRDRDAWDDAFVDALCEPPEGFTYGGVVAHVLEYGAVRRHVLMQALIDLGAPVKRLHGDPLNRRSIASEQKG